MEIYNPNRLIRPRQLFKIDLIVWKCTFLKSVGCSDTRFKIDLIVWKFGKLTVGSVEFSRFKIDLIVWKLNWWWNI